MSTDALPEIRGARVAHLIESDGPGGAERMLSAMAGELAAGGCPGVAFLPERGEGWLGRELEAAGVQVEHYRLQHPFSLRFVRDLAAAFRAHRIDIAHSHEFAMAVYNAWATRRAGIPHVITMHGSRYYAGRWQRRLAMRYAVAKSGAAVAVSQELATHLRRDLFVPRQAITVIPNGVRAHPLPLPALRGELGLAPDDRVILAVGNLYPVKGHRHLVEALALLPSSLRAHVVIAGRGDLAAELTERAAALGVAARLHLLGLRDDIPNLLASADVFVQPSISEGLPLALLEAMFAGRAIVASDVGEIPAALAEGSGVLVPPADAAALGATLGRLLENRAERASLGTLAARRAGRVYGLDTMLASYARIYASLLSPAGVRRREAEPELAAPRA